MDLNNKQKGLFRKTYFFIGCHGLRNSIVHQRNIIMAEHRGCVIIRTSNWTNRTHAGTYFSSEKNFIVLSRSLSQALMR